MKNAADKLIATLAGLQNSEQLLADFSLSPAIEQARSLGALVATLVDALEDARDDLLMWQESAGDPDDNDMTDAALKKANEALQEAEKFSV